MLIRIWRASTTAANAAPYQQLLLSEIFPGIHSRSIPGYLGIRLDRRDEPDGVEFVTTMLFASIEDVITFAGCDYRTSVVPASARALLSRFDPEAVHYDLVVGMGAMAPPAVALRDAMTSGGGSTQRPTSSTSAAS